MTETNPCREILVQREPLDDTCRKVVFYIDNHHTSVGLQNKILGSVSRDIEQKIYNTIFVEGGEGPYILNNFKSEEELIKTIVEEQIGGLASSVLAYRSSGKFKVYGVDDLAILKQQIAHSKKKIDMCTNREKGLTIDDLSKIIEMEDIIRKESYSRSIIAAEKIDKYMTEFNIKTAGVIFGSRHFCYMEIELGRRNIRVEPVLFEAEAYSIQESLEHISRSALRVLQESSK